MVTVIRFSKIQGSFNFTEVIPLEPRPDDVCKNVLIEAMDDIEDKLGGQITYFIKLHISGFDSSAVPCFPWQN